MQTLRLQRVQELLKRAIGEVIRREVPIDKVGVVTVNDVNVSSDLHSAAVFIGVIGKDYQKRDALALLNRDRKRLQTLVGREIVLKYTPQLKFLADDSVPRGDRVLKILDELEKADATATPDEKSPEGN